MSIPAAVRLENERRRKVAIKCLELEGMLESQGLSKDEIDEKVASFRTLLLRQPYYSGSPNMTSTTNAAAVFPPKTGLENGRLVREESTSVLKNDVYATNPKLQRRSPKHGGHHHHRSRKKKKKHRHHRSSKKRSRRSTRSRSTSRSKSKRRSKKHHRRRSRSSSYSADEEKRSRHGSRSPSKERDRRATSEERPMSSGLPSMKPLTVKVDEEVIVGENGKAEHDQPSASTSGIGPSPKDSAVMSGCEEGGVGTVPEITATSNDLPKDHKRKKKKRSRSKSRSRSRSRSSDGSSKFSKDGKRRSNSRRKRRKKRKKQRDEAKEKNSNHDKDQSNENSGDHVNEKSSTMGDGSEAPTDPDSRLIFQFKSKRATGIKNIFAEDMQLTEEAFGVSEEDASNKITISSIDDIPTIGSTNNSANNKDTPTPPPLPPTTENNHSEDPDQFNNDHSQKQTDSQKAASSSNSNNKHLSFEFIGKSRALQKKRFSQQVAGPGFAGNKFVTIHSENRKKSGPAPKLFLPTEEDKTKAEEEKLREQREKEKAATDAIKRVVQEAPNLLAQAHQQQDQSNTSPQSHSQPQKSQQPALLPTPDLKPLPPSTKKGPNNRPPVTIVQATKKADGNVIQHVKSADGTLVIQVNRLNNNNDANQEEQLNPTQRLLLSTAKSRRTRSRTRTRSRSRSYSYSSSRSRSRSRSSRSRSRSRSHGSPRRKSRSHSRSPGIPRRRGSPSFLEKRRITSARKRPIPYKRRATYSRYDSPSSDSSWSSYSRSTSRSRSRSSSRSSRSRSRSSSYSRNLRVPWSRSRSRSFSP